MSLEILTVFVVAPLAVLVCYDIAKKNSRANILMVIIATAELYGGKCRPTPHRHPLPIGLRGRAADTADTCLTL